MPLDRYRLVRRRKAETSGDAVLQQLHIDVLEFDDSVAVNTNQMIVRRMLDKIRIIDLGVRTEVNYATSRSRPEAAACDKRSRVKPISDPLRHHEQFLRCKMLVRSERRINNRLALDGAPQSFFRQELAGFRARALRRSSPSKLRVVLQGRSQGSARELQQSKAKYRCCIPALAGFFRLQSIVPGNFKTNPLLRSGNPKDACVILPLAVQKAICY